MTNHRTPEQDGELSAAQKVLIGAAWLLVHKGHTKGAFGRTKDGTPCSSYARSVACFCSRGAITRANSILGTLSASEAGWRLECHVGSVDIMMWNDDPRRTASEVIRAMREAAVGPELAKKYWPATQKDSSHV